MPVLLVPIHFNNLQLHKYKVCYILSEGSMKINWGRKIVFFVYFRM